MKASEADFAEPLILTSRPDNGDSMCGRIGNVGLGCCAVAILEGDVQRIVELHNSILSFATRSALTVSPRD